MEMEGEDDDDDEGRIKKDVTDEEKEYLRVLRVNVCLHRSQKLLRMEREEIHQNQNELVKMK